MKKLCLSVLLTVLPLVAMAAPLSKPKPSISATLVKAPSNNALSAVNLDFYRPILFTTASPSPNSDPKMVNPWGFVFTPEGNAVVANNGTSTSTIYTPTGGGLNFNPGTLAPVRPTLFINVPSDPTGIVSNHASNTFKIKTSGGKKGAAEYIYATEEGTILAYNRVIDPLNAILVADRSSKGSVYKGLAIGVIDNEYFLYATDFHNAKIDIFDSQFKFVKSFTDPSIPNGFAPFGIINFSGKLYVSYAKQLPPANVDDNPGPGNGFVDIFTPSGKFLRRLISQGQLNSPWGMAVSPSNYGAFSNALLVGNFGDGFINAYNPVNGAFLGKLFDSTSAPIQIPGLRGLRFSLSNPARPQLFFTAGPAAQTDGLFGVIQYAANDLSPN